MKSKKQLEKIFNKAKGNANWYSFESFLHDVKLYRKSIGKTICYIDVSRSGMTRKFNFDHFNMLFNIVYHGVKSWDPVRVGGCGMDMHWHLKFTVCESLFTKKELEKYNMNYECSSGKTL